ncbi:MAG: 4Fe-4S cluster-binding domain-containing protein [Lachnospiraceae bacterium]|nr:4Fe-4S cluster-binding domain-containing protein [Lachnospiraceae bacterium]
MGIAVWGAGKFGKFVIRQLMNNSNIQVKCVIDRRADELEEVSGIPVVSPKSFKEKFSGDVEAVLVAFMNGVSAIKELKGLGIGKIGIISNLAYRYGAALEDNIWEDSQIIWSENVNENLPILSILETNVVDYCNLNCKGCSHFSNIFTNGSEVAFEDFERDIQYLSKKINIVQFNLLGGEVFLSSDLEKYINCLEKYMPATVIQLVTNGILIPKQSPERMRFLAENNIYVSITEYPPVTPMKEKIREILTGYGIHFEMRQAVATFGKNIDVSGDNDPWEAQRTCRESGCHFLRNGKIYKCPFSALGNYFFKHYNISLHFEEGIDIYNRENDWKEIIDNLDRKPVEQCKFCGVEERFPWAVSTQPVKEEWMI